MNIKNKILALFAVLVVMPPVTPVLAHGGNSVEIDSCRIPVGNQWVRFTAYTPEITADTEFCNNIPQKSRTNLVLDYNSKKLRNMTVEFEITKEPEGKVIYHRDAATVKTGTLNAVVDFTTQPTGNYLAHVTLIDGEERTDAHLPFTVGATEPSTSNEIPPSADIDGNGNTDALTDGLLIIRYLFHQCSPIGGVRDTNLATRELIKLRKDVPMMIAF